MNKKQKVAIVCDWLTTMGGAERVVLELHRMFPEAPIYTSSYSPERMPLFDGADVRTGFIQKLPFSHKHQLWPVLRRRYFSKLVLDKYDLVISSSGAEAKAVKVPNGIHVNYCHTPTQYYWVRPDEYMTAKTAGGLSFLDPVWRFGLRLLKPWMKRWDYLAAQNPDILVANSTAVKKRIFQYYDRESVVVCPPVDTEKFSANITKKRNGSYLIVGRQVHHKRFDLAIEAANEAKVSLRVVGDGPEHERLAGLAGETVELLGRVSDEELVNEFQSAKGYIFPQEDDFGIVAAEAMAAGTPVIALRKGGALDTVIDGETGVFFAKQRVDSLVEAIEKLEKIKWNHQKISKHAEKFDVATFRSRINEVIKSAQVD